MKKILTIGYYILIAGILIVALLLVVSPFSLLGDFKAKIVLSGSMEPAITTGSLVIIHPTETYYVGDVVTFGGGAKTDIPTTHRIIKVRAESGGKIYTTKGDANTHEDTKEVRNDNVIGKVVIDIPYAGFLLDFVRRPIGFLLLIVLPSIGVAIDEFYKIYVESRKYYTVKKTNKKKRFLVPHRVYKNGEVGPKKVKIIFHNSAKI